MNYEFVSIRKGVVVTSSRLHSKIRLEIPSITKSGSKRFIEGVLTESYLHSTAAAECLNKVKGQDLIPANGFISIPSKFLFGFVPEHGATCYFYYYHFFSSGAATQRGSWPPHS